MLHGLQEGSGEDAVAALIPVLNHPASSLVPRSRAGAGGACRRRLQIDSGMCRLGFAEAELARDRAAALDLAQRLVMSHLACEEAANPIQEQRARFERLRTLLPEAPASLANSSGIFLGPAFHGALCRPGVALYGVNPTPGRANPMAPVVTLEAPVLQVHEVAEPGSVGYGATYRTRAGRAHRHRAGRLCRRLSAHRERSRDRPDRRAGTARRPGVDGPDQPGCVGASADAVRPGTMVELIGGPDGSTVWPRPRARSATKC